MAECLENLQQKEDQCKRTDEPDNSTCESEDQICTERPEPQDNTTLRDSLKRKSGLVLCDVCTEVRQEALQSCLDCGVSFCKSHLEPHNIPRFNKHMLIKPVKNLENYICQKHKRPLELICKDDQTRMCQFCTVAEHKNHNIIPINQGEVKQMIKEREMKIQEIKDTRAELQKRIKDLEQEITELKGIYTELEQLSHTEDHLHLLQIYPSLCRPPHTTNWTNISVDPHLSVETVRNALSQLQKKLDENIKESAPTQLRRKQQYKVDVTLDPDTAHPCLILSDDGKQVTYVDKKQKRPDNPKRFTKYIDVLGKEGFSSGRFYYEVQFGGKTEWSLGVVKESVNKKEEIELKPQNGFWTLILRNGNEYTACAKRPVLLYLEEKPQKVGVFVDYEEGLVSFYDVEARSHIYSFTGQTFTEDLYPFFSPGLKDGGKISAQLTISPVSN